jgi:hypothetical protein
MFDLMPRQHCCVNQQNGECRLYRLKDRFIYEEFGKRKTILMMILLLSATCRAQNVGMSQIKNTALTANANKMFIHYSILVNSSVLHFLLDMILLLDGHSS